MLHASPVLLGSRGRVADHASLWSCRGPPAGQGTPSTWERAAPRLHPQTGQQELPRTMALRIQPVPRGCFWPEQHPQACKPWGQEQPWHPRPCSDPPEPQRWPPRNPKLALPTLAWQTRAEQAPYWLFPCGISAPAAGNAYLEAQQGSLQGRLPWLGAGDHLPGDAGVRAASLGAAGKAPCWEEALRLQPAAPPPGCLLPPPSLGASSCPVRRDLPPEQEKRNESDSACGPAAPLGGEGIPFPALLLPPGFSGASRTPHRCLPAWSSIISPQLQPSRVEGP